MSTGLHLEILTQVVQTDKERTFTQERFIRQIELTQNHAYVVDSDMTWWSKIRRMTARSIVITLAMRPLRLTVQWA